MIYEQSAFLSGLISDPELSYKLIDSLPFPINYRDAEGRYRTCNKAYERLFGKSREEATQIMLHVHRRGVGICGVYTYEVAETKVTQVIDFARRHQHPLQCTMEKE